MGLRRDDILSVLGVVLGIALGDTIGPHLLSGGLGARPSGHGSGGAAGLVRQPLGQRRHLQGYLLGLSLLLLDIGPDFSHFYLAPFCIQCFMVLYIS